MEDDPIRLLRDIHAVFETDRVTRPDVPPDKQAMDGAQLVGRLLQIEESPWAAPETGRPMTQHKLASLLRPFRIFPHEVGPKIRRKRGYQRLQFTEAWAAYLSISPEAPPLQSVHHVHLGGTPSDSEDFRVSTEGSDGHSENALKPAEFCDGGHGGHSATPPSGENISFPEEIGPSGNHDGKDFPLPGRVIMPRPSAVEQAIRELASAHPHWTDVRLAKAAHQPVARVRKALINGSGQLNDSGSPQLEGPA